MNKEGKITRQFTITFTVFTLIVLIITGAVTYYSQLLIYKEQARKNAYHICSYLRSLMEAEGEDTLAYLDYFMEHHDEMDIPVDFESYVEFKTAFEELLKRDYPDKTFGIDLKIEDLNEEVRKAYFIYRHAYWLQTFENAKADFDILYTYFVIPDEQPSYMTFVLDAIREPRESDPQFINLGITVEQPVSIHQKMWEAYNTGKTPEGYDTADNEFGHTYGYFSPFVVNGRVIGVICAEVAVADFNHNILLNTVRQNLYIALVLILGIAILVIRINRSYIKRLVKLEGSVSTYAKTKDVSISTEIEQNASGNDEISRLSDKIAILILELEDYMKNLLKTSDELHATQEYISVVNEIANKDSLTGIRNRLAYDNEAVNLKWKIASGTAKFGIAVVDLNFLKRINDTYGHEKGNIAIKNLCTIVCKIFSHSPVFRIGGDEFAIILQGQDLENVDSLIAEFNTSMKHNQEKVNESPWEYITAAIGYSIYDPEIDNTVDNVFSRADKAMYARKKEMKAVRTE